MAKDKATPPSRTRLSDIAARCGVSSSTASRALSGQPGVGAALRRRILDEASRAHYPTGVGLTGARIVTLVSDSAMADYARNQFTWYVLMGLRERARAVGAEVVLAPLSDGDAAGLAAILARAQPQGLLLLTLDSPRLVDTALDLGVPTVLLNGHDPALRVSGITPANRAIARLAVDHLIGLGHRDILFVERPGRLTIQHRREGWRDGLAAVGGRCDDTRILAVDEWIPEPAAAAVRAHVARRGVDFTAVLCAGDVLAGGVLTALTGLGIAVPGAVSVMGMDDLPVVELWRPPLTTMHLPGQAMGGIALDLLQDAMVRADPIPRQVELAGHLVERASVARRRD
jgi:DNA-binding LacI/PurR family transcriptional regulator